MKRHDEFIPADKRFKHPIGPQVHAILWNEWDPIGVSGVSNWPDDEYNGYVWPIISKVMRNEPVEQIADYLDWAMSEHMGLSGDLNAIRLNHLRLAAKLKSLLLQGPLE